MAPTLRMSFVDDAELVQEVAQNLRLGRAFVQGSCDVEVLSDCVLLLARADGAELPLAAQVVMVTPAGVGVALRPFGAEVLDAIERFAAGELADEAAAEGASEDGETSDQQPDSDTTSEPPEDEDSDALAEDDEFADEDDPSDRSSSRPNDVQREVMHERMRKLSLVEQQKIARSGDLTDRVMLERLYGKSVWEGLLHNPKLTVPEVARMARKGTMPRSMIELIVDNATWAQQGAVRRALLSNPRVSSEGVLKILRLAPKHELKAMTKSTAYTAAIRDAARKLLKI